MYKEDLAWNNPHRLIYNKTQPTKWNKDEIENISSLSCFLIFFFFLCRLHRRQENDPQIKTE